MLALRCSSKNHYMAHVKHCRRLSSVANMIAEGRLRDIDAFGADKLQTVEYDKVINAYSCSHLVHIPINHLPLHEMDSICTEVMERMLATSLLCQYRATSTSLAREICRRIDKSETKVYSFGPCMLALYADDQWEDMYHYGSVEDLVNYLHHSMSGESTHNPVSVEVACAVLRSWMQASAVEPVHAFIHLLVTSDSHLESLLIGSPEVLKEVVLFLRRHGKHDLSHRMLSVLQHGLQRRVFDRRGERHGGGWVNQCINDLITFSTCLEEKQDMKYLSNVYSFYLKHILPGRPSYVNRLVDVENILKSVLHSPHSRLECYNLLGNRIITPLRQGNERTSQHQSDRALVGYSFYNRLHRSIRGAGSGGSLMSPKVLAQLAEIVGHLSSDDSFAQRPTESPGSARRRTHNSAANVSRRSFTDRRLAALNQLKDKFMFKYSNPDSLKQNKSNFSAHKYFFTAYMSSLRLILNSNPDSRQASKERGVALIGVLQCLRHTGIPFGFTEEFSRVLVELYISRDGDDALNGNITAHPSHSTSTSTTKSTIRFQDISTTVKPTVLEVNIKELMAFVDENRDCFHFDTVCKHVITHLGDSGRTSTVIDPDTNAYLSSSNNICRFLKSLSDNGKIESFRHQYLTKDSPSGESPVRRYRSFKECTEREWCTIKLLQAACVQVLNLHHPAVVPDLMVVLSALSSHQLVPYSYWSQAIALCENGKKWEDLKVLVQLLLYQGKMIQYANVQSVLAAYVSTHSPHVAFRIARAMRREGVRVPAETYRALCVALGRLGGRPGDGGDNCEMAEKAFQDLFDSYGPIAFTGNFDTSRGADLVRCRSEWVINSRNESMIKQHLKDCGLHITCPGELLRVYEETLAALPSQYYEAGVFLITTMLSEELGLPNDVHIDRFIDAAIDDDRLTLAASMLRSIKHLKASYEASRLSSGAADDDADDTEYD